MNLNKVLIATIFLSMVFSCRNNNSKYAANSEQNFSNNKTIKFKKFLSKFKMLKFPFEADTRCYIPEESEYQKFDKSNDELFNIDTQYDIAIGQLPDTTNFHAVIYASPTVCYILSLATYSKGGTFISSDQISNGCGSDCGYQCSDKLAINSLTDITISNIIEMYECDSLGKETAGTWEKTIEIKKVTVGRDGKIVSKVTKTKGTRMKTNSTLTR